MNLRPFFALLATTGFLFADVTLPAVFSDHAVLQKSARVPVWGKAAPGEPVTVTLGNAKAEATTDAAGRWMATLDLSQSGPGPYEMVVQGKNRLAVADVLVGEVWVCSGQSNMEWRLGSVISSKDEIPQSANLRLRQFAVTKAAAGTPADDLKGSWQIASPETVKGFTAVGYYFGKTLEKDLQTPVGLLLTSWGGTQVEPWIPQEAFSADAELKQGADAMIDRKAKWKPLNDTYLVAQKAWDDKYQLADQNSGTLPDDANWQPLVKESMPKEPGVAWYRLPLPVNSEQAGKPFPIALNSVDGLDQIYWNGKLVAEAPAKAGSEPARRTYSIPADQVKEGSSTLLVRVFNSRRAPVMEKFEGNAPWEVKVEKAVPLTAEAKRDLPVSPGKEPGDSGIASYLYNAMVNPLVPYAIRGAIWYQGESNAGRAFQYRSAFPMLIEGWRKKWNQGDFPFYFCQLANFQAKTNQPGESDWAELREAQTLTTKVPNTGQAILIDLGESGDIHPQNKAEVGRRLAQLALADTYGRKIPAHGPTFKSAGVEGDKMRVTFTHTDGGLVAQPVPATYDVNVKAGTTEPLKRNSPDSPIEGFAICGADQKWVWANAHIDGDSVIVSAPGVTQPVAVRYGWANNPNVNLYNGAGFPAGPFRSDDFPIKTQNGKYGLPAPVTK